MEDAKPSMSQVRVPIFVNCCFLGLMFAKFLLKALKNVILHAVADGFARSEAAVAILVQREKNAKRNYVRILNIRSNTDGYKPEGVMYPNRHEQERLFRESYQQVGIDPKTVNYIETHGTGTPTGDPEELNSMHTVFCNGNTRDKPLLLGSVKTNIGHTEAAAGLCALAKVIGTIQTGKIPPNLHFKKPKPEEEHLFDGTMQVWPENFALAKKIVQVQSLQYII